MSSSVIAEVLQGYRSELIAGGRSPGTITVRLSHARRCLSAVGKPVGAITREDLTGWLAAGEWGPAARASARSSVRSLFAWLAASGRIEHSPAEDLPRVAIPRGVPRPAPDVTVARAIALSDPTVALAVEIMAAAGLRRAECARVRAVDVEPFGRGWGLRVAGKGGHVRVVPISPSLAARIRARGGWIFPGGQDGHVSAGWLGKLVSRALPAGVTPHKLRHRYATVTYSDSHDLRAVQELLGHASIATTQIYVGVQGDDVARAAAAAWTIAA